MKDNIKEIIELALKSMDINENVELTPSKSHGDFSTNIAMKLASKLNKSPVEVANEIISKIDFGLIEKIEVAGPGFINIFVNDETTSNTVKEILEKKDEYGKLSQGKKINIEYVSANPTGYLHIGHARGAVLGSTLYNILKFAGNQVDGEYYINDAGNQINVLAESVRVRYLQALGQDIKLPEESYGGNDIVDVANMFVEKYGDSLMKEPKERFKTEAKDILLDILKEHLAKYGVTFDIFSSEQRMYDEDRIKPTLEKLSKHTYEKDGALWLDTISNEDDKDRVLVKTDGTYTYLTPDIAYHDVKLSRGYDELINIWGADHLGYIKRMETALTYLGLPKEKLDILTIQLVKLVKNNEEVKMSKRTGNTFTIIELLEEVGVDAARWFMIDRSNTSSFVFDIDFVNKKDSDNPVFTVQYTHARANQLLEKSDKDSVVGTYEGKEKELVNELGKFSETIERIANTHKVHLLPQYVLKVVGLFNSWYTTTKLIGNENEESMLALVEATKIVIANSLKLLGIKAPNKM